MRPDKNSGYIFNVLKGSCYHENVNLSQSMVKLGSMIKIYK